VDEVEKASSLAASALKQAVLLRLVEGEVAIQLPPGIPAATAEKRRGEIEAVFTRFFGRPTRLSLTVGASPPIAGGAPAALSLADAEAAERTNRSSRVRETARAHPNIQEAVRVLEGEIGKIEEL
jgi:DNA polymerase-3 subunit gamma/tau